MFFTEEADAKSQMHLPGQIFIAHLSLFPASAQLWKGQDRIYEEEGGSRAGRRERG